MSIADLAFVFLILTTGGLLTALGWSLLRRRARRARHLAGLLAAGLAAYFALLIIVSLTASQRVLAIGEPLCSDDWCLAITEVTTSATPTIYTVTFEVSSRARRVAMRENGVVVHLVDARGTRFAALADPAGPGFNTWLQAGQVVTLTRVFATPDVQAPVAIVIEREGMDRFPRLLIIGDNDSLFHPPVMVRLP